MKYQTSRTGIRVYDTVFPRGIYYVAHYPVQKAKRIADLDKIAAAGFTHIATPIDLDDRPFLDRCKQIDLQVIVEPNIDWPDLKDFLRPTDPIFALQAFDDIDAKNPDGSPKNTREQIENVVNDLKRMFPNLLTYASGGHWNEASRVVGVTDLHAHQAYPLPGEEMFSSLKITYRPVKIATDAADVPLIANPQAYKQGNFFPSDDQIEAMAWIAVCYGVKGVIFYTFFDHDYGNPPNAITDLSTRESTLRALSRFNAIVERYENYFVDGKHTFSDDAEIVQGKWDLDEISLFIRVHKKNLLIENWIGI